MLTKALNKNHDMITESHRQMVEAQVELQKELFERQDKRDRNAEAASARLQSAQAMPREQVIHQHITNPERPAQDINTLLASHLESTEQRMLRHMHNQFGQSGALISHLAGRVDNLSAAAHALANKPPPDTIVVQGATGPAGPPGPPGAGSVSINQMTKVTNNKMVVKLKSKKHAGLTVSASSNPPPPPGAPGASALLNPVVEAPVQLQAPSIAVPLSAGPVTYKALPIADHISDVDKKVQERLRLAQAKARPTRGPQAVARMGVLADDSRDKRKQAKRTMLDFEQRPRVPKRMAAEQGGRPNKPAPPSRVPEAPAPLPTKKAKYEPVTAPAPKRSGRATSGKAGRSSGRAPKPFALTDV